MNTPIQNHAPRGLRKYSFVEPLESRIAPAAVIVVNSLLDTAVAGKTNLRQALAQADTDLTAHPGVVNKIIFKLPPAAANTENTITLGGTALSSNGDVTIVGPGAGKLIINGNNMSGVFNIGGTTGTTTISGLSIINGNLANGGAGIYSTESLTLKNVVVSGNTSNSFGAGVNIHGNDATPPKITIMSSQITGNSHGNSGSSGVYLYKAGVLNVTNSVISGNFRGIGEINSSSFQGATFKGSLIAGNAGVGLSFTGNQVSSKISIVGSRITGNAGGGMSSSVGNVVITGSTIENNTATYYGGGLRLIDPSSVTISSSNIFGNKTSKTNAADQGGGGIFVSGINNTTLVPVKIIGSKFADNSSALDGGGIFAENGVTLSITGSTIAGNNAAGIGGGIATHGVTASGVVNTTITSSVIAGNFATARGGGLAAQGTTASEGDGTLSIISSIINGNASGGADGGVNVFSSAAVTIKNVKVTNNTAAAFAGGLDIIDTQSFSITGGLISGNTANGNGGGVRLFSAGGTIKSTVITGNVSTGEGGGIYENSSQPTIITSKIFANTAATDPDIHGPFKV